MSSIPTTPVIIVEDNLGNKTQVSLDQITDVNEKAAVQAVLDNTHIHVGKIVKKHN